MIDLDHNATTPLSPAAAETWLRLSKTAPGNPGSRHAAGRQARVALEDAREHIAQLLGAEPDEVYFTSGGTEANNLALQGLLSGPSGTIALTQGEHPSSLEMCLAQVQRGQRLHWLRLNERGELVAPSQQSVPWPELRLMTFLLGHNETGVMQEVGPWAALCAQHRVPLHLDAVQAVGKIPLNFRELGVTSLSFGAHKFSGPRGIGGLLVRRGVRFSPLLFGGHQESDRRPGTEAVPLIGAMATALSEWHTQRAARSTLLEELRNRLQAGLCGIDPTAVVHGRAATRLPNTLSIAFPGLDGEALLVALDLAGVCCSMGSACASGSAEPSPVLLAMGISREIARSTLRFSVGITNTLAEIDEAVTRVARVIERMRQRGA